MQILEYGEDRRETLCFGPWPEWGDGIMKMQIVRLDFGGKANEGQ